MISFAFTGFQPFAKLAQTVRLTLLAKQHGHKVILAGEAAGMAHPSRFGHGGSEVAAKWQCGSKPKGCRKMLDTWGMRYVLRQFATRLPVRQATGSLVSLEALGRALFLSPVLLCPVLLCPVLLCCLWPAWADQQPAARPTVAGSSSEKVALRRIPIEAMATEPVAHAANANPVIANPGNANPVNANPAGATRPVLEARDVTVAAVVYEGQPAIRLLPAVAADQEVAAQRNVEGGGMAIVPGVTFHHGTLTLEVAGKPRPGAPAAARGFIGLAFRVAADPSEYECFYLRPTNGRAEDQVRRNHSTQYIAMPQYTWARLRKEEPERYESYVDLVPGAWTKVRITVDAAGARLYVHGSPQPALVVPQRKLSDSPGRLALWIGLGTEGYFRNLQVSP